jgi:hypothetical protein
MDIVPPTKNAAKIRGKRMSMITVFICSVLVVSNEIIKCHISANETGNLPMVRETAPMNKAMSPNVIKSDIFGIVFIFI